MNTVSLNKQIDSLEKSLRKELDKAKKLREKNPSVSKHHSLVDEINQAINVLPRLRNHLDLMDHFS